MILASTTPIGSAEFSLPATANRTRNFAPHQFPSHRIGMAVPDSGGLTAF